MGSSTWNTNLAHNLFIARAIDCVFDLGVERYRAGKPKFMGPYNLQNLRCLDRFIAYCFYDTFWAAYKRYIFSKS